MYKPGLDKQQSFDCSATAALLRSLTPLVWAAHVGALAAAFRYAWWVLACWALVVYFAVRVQLDAGLFELLARDPATAPERLDGWLESAGLRKAGTARSIEERCRGGRRLAVWLVGACALEAVALAWVWIRRNV